ncbi:MAG TPA: PQQ-dependent sugar dehydrogenase [Vicinamibacterales bacterium]|nr:PQQ-dependent sugar dehydrogenase [Vicinamibacterales bacterium]
MSRLWVLLAVVIVACGKSPSAPPPPSTTPGPTETITGNERLGWDQRASDAVELATFRYAIYVDGVRTELTGATCASSPSNGSFACSARLPTISRGTHTIELASFIVDGSVFESARSSALRVSVSLAPTESEAPIGASAERSDDRRHFTLERVLEGVDRPRDLAFAPDGRLFVVEAAGRIRIVHRESLVDSGAPAAPAATPTTRERAAQSGGDDAVLALAFDPQFERTHFVYALATSRSRDDEPMFTVARFREANDTLADRVVLLDSVRASDAGPSGSLRFGADGKLFVALDAGADPSLAEDLASFNGKVLRLNTNGTTPDDQAGASPLYSLAYRSPRGFDWAPTGVLWVVDAGDAPVALRSSRLLRGASISAVAAPDGPRKRGVTKATFRLPDGSAPSSIAAYRGDLLPVFQHSLLIASYEGQHLLQVRLDPEDGTRILGMNRLLESRVGGIRAVATGPDGAVYFATDRAIYRLMP